MPLFLPDRNRQISEFEGNMVYTVSPKTTRATQRNLVSQKQTKKIFKKVIKVTLKCS